MCSLSDVASPSSGICTASAELRVELARDLRVCVEDLRETVASEARLRIFARTDVRPGMMSESCGVSLCALRIAVLTVRVYTLESGPANRR